MTKKQENGVRHALAKLDMDAAWIDEAVARCREFHTDEDVVISVENTVRVLIANQVVATRELERQNAVNERNQRARDAVYEIAMNTPDSGVIH